jgi:GNAT superfamily N-acetyltransferase
MVSITRQKKVTLMTAVQIRRATEADSQHVSDMAWALLSELFPGLYNAEQLQASVDHILNQSPDVSVFLAERAGKPVGLITLNRCTAIYALGEFGEISELYVDANSRSLGVGNMLINTAVEFAISEGWTMLEVGAPDVPKWQRTVNFYIKNGFAEVGPRLYLSLAEI